MRVLYLYKDYYPVLGGIENHIRVLAEGLRARGVDARVLVTNTTGQTVEETIGGVPVVKTARQVNVSSAPVSFPSFRGCASWKQMPTSPTRTCRIRRERWRTCWRAGPGALSSPITATSSGSACWVRSIARFLWQVLRQARLIAVSNPVYIQDSPFLRRYAEKCRVIHFGLNLDRFAATPQIEADAAAWRARYGNRPLLLFVGRLRHYKGVNVLIEAMQQLPEATALIVGIGPMAEEWQQQAAGGRSARPSALSRRAA